MVGLVFSSEKPYYIRVVIQKETRKYREGKILPLAFLANLIITGCYINPGLYQDSVHFPTIFDIYFGSFCTINFVRLLILHVEPDPEINPENQGRAFSL